MGNLAEKRDRFEQLMRRADIPFDIIDSFFSEGYIDRVVCSRTNKEWTFIFTKQKLIPLHIYRQFCQLIQTRFAHIVTINCVIQYSNEVEDAELIAEYWGLFIEWVQQKAASVNGWMSKATFKVDAGHIIITMLNSTGLEMAQKKKLDQWVQQYFEQFFGRRYEVRFLVGESSQEAYEEFAQLISEQERTAVQDLKISTEQESLSLALAEPGQRLMVGYEIKDQPIPIQQIEEEEKKATIQGAIFGLDVKALKNGTTLFQFSITDFSNSLMVKVFAKTKEELRNLKPLDNGKWIKARGKIEFDRFMTIPELVMIPSDINELAPPNERMDDAPEKRVEFHLHTSMSAMDGITPIEQYIKLAAQWGHKAIAVTDHACIQAYPEASKAAKKHGIKMIYGVEANVVNDAVPIILNEQTIELNTADYVIFDIETTGLSVTNNKIIEIAAVKMFEGKITERYSTFVNPHERIPYNITQLTSITDEMVANAPELDKALPEFIQFVGDAILVAHNARFDMGFIQAALRALGMPRLDNPVLDTLELARFLHPSLKNHRLNTLTDKYKIKLENHHRAIDDAEALGGVLFQLLADSASRGIMNLNQFNSFIGQELTNARPFHCCIYALNDVGKKNLFKLISISHTEYFKKVPCIPKSKLAPLREGLLISSGCEKGEFFEAVLNKSLEEAEQVADFYDVLEIQPLGLNKHLVEKGLVGSIGALENANRTICEIGKRHNKMVIATGNAHYLHPRDKIYRDITILGITGFSPLKDMVKPDVHLRTTNEMLQEFAYLGNDTAIEVVVTNTSRLADQFEPVELFPSKLFTPTIDGADEEIRSKCYQTAAQVYGTPLPDIIAQRLEKELIPIIHNGYSANILISEKLVKKSNEDGYLVGSRGSVGSSFVATMLGISEVNPMPAHYICSSCKYSEWFLDGSVPSGFDMPDKNCPSCGRLMKGEGQDIPFETFMGFKGEKVPDIDLNFSGVYQAVAHNYTKELFGEKCVFRAGTISTVADKTAFGYTKKYEEEHGKKWRTAELNRLASGCTGVKRSTGQHPGGIVIVPNYIEVEEVTPIQYPADDVNADWKTTHFDYHAFENNLLKLDILGHDDPTMMRMLQDLTGIDPTAIPMNDPRVMSIFNSTEAIGVKPEQIRSPVATYGIPEMGTKFVRQMLQETQPNTFADLLQISGLSHGTGVWLGNAQELIRKGTCNIKTVIGCRDDIMLYLIYKAGMDAGLAFAITESVRKGKGLKDEWIEEMKKHKVPQWYIDSCLRIEYMFPKAHAAAYVISAVRTSFFKVYYPIDYYAAYFTVRAADFDIESCSKGYDYIKRQLVEIEEKGFQATPKEKGMISILELALEMTARGFHFKGIDIYRSDANNFIVDNGSLIPPFSAIQGIGENAARNIAAAKSDGEYLSIEDFQMRSKASKTVVELLGSMGCFRGLPESNQLSLFDF